MSDRHKYRSANLIDFSDSQPSPYIKQFESHIAFGDFTVCRVTLSPNPGMFLGARQLVISISTGASYKLTTREGESEREVSIKQGSATILGPQAPQYLEWATASPRFNVVAIEKATVERILSEANSIPSTRIQAALGVRDNVLRQLVQACHDEIDECGDCGRLFMDGLASAIVTHVYRTYANASFPILAKGGLTPKDSKRVLDYIEEHLHSDIGLDELASSVSLSAHYFTEAFKKTLGMPPYRYLLHRRVERAKELLLTADLSPAKIAAEVGFSSQSQLTTNFRKIVGTTPARFRRSAQ